MMQNLYFLYVFVNIDTYEVAPDICNHDNGVKIGHTFLDSDVRVFNVEAAALQTFEHRLNLPSLLVQIICFLGTSSIRSSVLELPRLSIILKAIGKAMPS